ncbi:MAG: hypothetical protein EOP11_19335 [Proteobacteria bacterium]|nr:MAG: hypothetical protein EOP11_19335 [Pseudomonadota bacterium]
MGKKFPWLINIGAGLAPGLFVYFNLRLHLSLCDFARDQVACRQDNSPIENWWQIALAVSVGLLAVNLSLGSLSYGYRSLRRRVQRRVRSRSARPAILSSASAED